MKQSKGQTRLANGLSYGIIAIFILMPFHAVLTTWLASSVSHFDLIRIWKDLLMVPLGLGALWYAFSTGLFKRLGKLRSLIGLIFLYGLLVIVLGIWAILAHRVNASALLYGWLNDLQYLAFFVIVLLVSAGKPLKPIWRQLLLVPASIVVLFGLLQHYVLPHDFLRHFGYGPGSLPTYETVDQKPAYIRLQSTLRGPNPLGAYLIVIVTSIAAILKKSKRYRTVLSLFVAGSLMVLFFTYSRSALLGTGLAVVVILWLNLQGLNARRVFYIGVAGLLTLSVGGILLLRHNDRAQNIFFHTDEHSRSPESSNQKRSSALKSGLEDVWHEPLGRGPGTAGPASVRNNHPARIAENYYLQIGQELGIVGLGLFLAINLYLVYFLWQQRNDMPSAVLLASFIGISFVNLLSHAWSDDTIALIWWGLAGLALSSAILNTNKVNAPKSRDKNYQKLS